METSLEPLGQSNVEPASDEEGRIETLVMQIKEMFSSLGDGDLSPSAYDTAWMARIPARDDASKLQFPTTLEWIMKNQLEDGSWGDAGIFLLYDRLVCTLSCVLTLRLWRQGEEHAAKGVRFLQAHIQDLEKQKSDSRTIGFEIIFPSMLTEARSLGLSLPYDLPCLQHIVMLGEEKKSRIPLELMHTVRTTLLHSLEAVQELVQWDRILRLQSANGSFSDSPSATAAAYLNTCDEKCLEYLAYIARRFKDHAPMLYPVDTYERNWVVDTIQRLGIDHLFHEEISLTLDFLYRSIRKDGQGWGRDAYIADIDSTCMSLRLLRLHGYPISPDVLECFKDSDESFICFMGETHKGVSEYFNLYRLSQIVFPGEKILKQAKSFAEKQLLHGSKGNQVHDKWVVKKDLQKEIQWALKNPWKMSLPRIEVRQYIDYYGENDVWIGKSAYRLYNINNSKYLDLAKLEYNKLQAMHTREANSIIKWWNSYSFDDLPVAQLIPEQIHFSICATIYEPEFSASRIAYTKCNCLESILRDIFQIHESIKELKLFCLAINEWKPALEHALPTTLKQVFMGIYTNMNDLAIELKNAQGKDVFPYLHDLRKLQVQDYLKIREDKDGKQSATFAEYVDKVKKGLGISIRLLPSMFLMGNVLSENIRYLDHRSKIQEHLTSYLALLNPMTEEWTAVHLYKKEHNCSEQDAKRYIEEKAEDAFAELVHEYLKPNKIIPHSCRRLIFEHGRITRFSLEKVCNGHYSEALERIYNPVPLLQRLPYA